MSAPAGDFLSGFSGSNVVFIFGDPLESATTAPSGRGCGPTARISRWRGAQRNHTKLPTSREPTQAGAKGA
jgi:hypothetical protein